MPQQSVPPTFFPARQGHHSSRDKKQPFIAVLQASLQQQTGAASVAPASIAIRAAMVRVRRQTGFLGLPSAPLEYGQLVPPATSSPPTSDQGVRVSSPDPGAAGENAPSHRRQSRRAEIGAALSNVRAGPRLPGLKLDDPSQRRSTPTSSTAKERRGPLVVPPQRAPGRLRSPPGPGRTAGTSITLSDQIRLRFAAAAQTLIVSASGAGFGVVGKSDQYGRSSGVLSRAGGVVMHDRHFDNRGPRALLLGWTLPGDAR